MGMPELFTDTHKHVSSLQIEVKGGHVKIDWNEFGFIAGVGLENPAEKFSNSSPTASALPRRVFRFIEDLHDYFEHGTPFSRTQWSDIEIAGWTEFQEKVYRATLSIPHGETRTYGWLATKIGMPLACRAVGQSLRKNPVPLLVPCHRVVSHLSLGGFMGADDPQAPELDLKRRLLDLENRFINPCFGFSYPSSK